MSKVFLSIVLVSAAAQTALALLAEGQLLALPVVAIMLYEAYRNLKSYIQQKQNLKSPPALFQSSPQSAGQPMGR
jgi:hypothetical protein